MNPREFLRLLFANKPKEHQILTWTRRGDEKISHWRLYADDAADVIDAYNKLGGFDIYTGIGLSPRDLGPRVRCPAAAIAGITAVWADLDVLGPMHAGKPLPATLEEALTILPIELRPTLIIRSGNGGAHAWWLLREPAIFASPTERALAARTVYRWHTMLRVIAGQKGWAFDRLADLARVLRPPGTKNWKDPAAPKPVELFRQIDQRYNLSDFDELLDEAGILGEGEQRPVQVPVPVLPSASSTAAAPALEPVSADFRVNLHASIPAETIAGWMEIDLRFQRTWLRERTDMADQSQSGYDLALATFGVDIRLPTQSIVDLIVHHRRFHRQKPRTRVDYYERTLARARQTTLGTRQTANVDPATEAAVNQAAAAAGSSTTRQAPASKTAVATTPLTRAALTLAISHTLELPVDLLRILRIGSDDPSYQLEFANGHRIHLATVTDLTEHGRLRAAIATALNFRIRRFRAVTWDLLAQDMLSCLEQIDTGIENDAVSLMRSHIENYLESTAIIPTIEGQSSDMVHMPMILQDHIAISSQDLQRYLNGLDTGEAALSLKRIASILAALGARARRVQGRKIQEQSRWLLPKELFPAAEYGPSTPGPANRPRPPKKENTE